MTPNFECPSEVMFEVDDKREKFHPAHGLGQGTTFTVHKHHDLNTSEARFRLLF